MSINPSDLKNRCVMKVVGSIKHWQQQTLDIQVVKYLASGSVPGSLFGVGILHFIQQQGENHLNNITLHLLGITILLVTIIALLQMLLVTFFPHLELPELPKFDLNTQLGRWQTVSIGVVLGCIVSLTSVASGSMFALVLIAFFRLDARQLVGSDISQAAILLLFTSLGHLTLGTVDWNLVFPIWLGSIPGVLLGAKNGIFS
jgi:uncharacterized protein